MYLDIGVHTQIQEQFEDESQIQLPDFLLVNNTHTNSLYYNIICIYTTVLKIFNRKRNISWCAKNYNLLMTIGSRKVRLIKGTPLIDMYKYFVGTYIHVCIHVCNSYVYCTVFDKLIWRTIGPKSFLFGIAQLSLWAMAQLIMIILPLTALTIC